MSDSMRKPTDIHPEDTAVTEISNKIHFVNLLGTITKIGEALKLSVKIDNHIMAARFLNFLFSKGEIAEISKESLSALMDRVQSYSDIAKEELRVGFEAYNTSKQSQESNGSPEVEG